MLRNVKRYAMQTEDWLRYHPALRSALSRYKVWSDLVAPSSSPHNIVSYVFPTVYPDTLFSLISNESDREVLARMGANVVPLPLYASHWVKPAFFAPRPQAERDYDIIMVAAFAKVKRHHVLFQTLRSMPAATRVLLVGQDQDGRTADTIHAEARWYG